MSRPSTSSRFSEERVGERRIADRRAQIGEEREILAQTQKARFRPHVIGHVVPFRPADRTEDDGVGGIRLGHRLLGDRHFMRVVANAADESFLGVEAGDALRVEEIDQPLHLGHHFGADAVAGEQQEFMGRHWIRLAIHCPRIAKGRERGWQGEAIGARRTN